jgi:hypothetical protein
MFGLWKGPSKPNRQSAPTACSIRRRSASVKRQPKGVSHRGFEHPQRDVPMINYPLKVRKVKKYGIITEL